jgi:hypothetical protein
VTEGRALLNEGDHVAASPDRIGAVVPMPSASSVKQTGAALLRRERFTGKSAT